MKKTGAFLAAIFMAFSLGACGGKPQETDMAFTEKGTGEAAASSPAVAEAGKLPMDGKWGNRLNNKKL